MTRMRGHRGDLVGHAGHFQVMRYVPAGLHRDAHRPLLRLVLLGGYLARRWPGRLLLRGQPGQPGGQLGFPVRGGSCGLSSYLRDDLGEQVGAGPQQGPGRRRPAEGPLDADGQRHLSG